jgi:hypothetical protein
MMLIPNEPARFADSDVSALTTSSICRKRIKSNHLDDDDDDWAIDHQRQTSVSFVCATIADDDNNNDDDRNSEPSKCAGRDRHNGKRERDARTGGRARTKARIDKLKSPP